MAGAILNYGVLDTAPELPFDDVVALAAQLCDTPIALVSLIDTDRQWFKARLGFDCDQTDLDRSVCRHVVVEAETIIITDLTADPRTASNPLVTGNPHIRFYAGAPLATRFGIVGALCVIDTEVRSHGLLPSQREGLERLSRQVVRLLEERRHSAELEAVLEERDHSRVAERLADARWRELYQNLDQGFVCGQVLRDDAGAIYDWRYVDVNPAWGELVGMRPEDARGRTVRELIPGIEDEWVMEFARVVETREPTRSTRQVGSLGRWYDGTAQWAGGDDFTLIFHEVTDRVGYEQRRDALLQLGDMLRDENDVAGMTRRAAEIVASALGISRVAFGWMNHDRLQVVVEPGWAKPGLPAIEGTYTFADYGRITDELLIGQPLVIEDIRTDPRTRDDLARWTPLDARGVVNMPVQERGRTVAILIAHDQAPRRWTVDELAFLRNAADRLEIGIARRRAEDRQDMLNGEISHRLKNTLAMVQAVASQTLRHLGDADALDAFMRRLQALGTAHDALTTDLWQATTMRPVVTGALANLGVVDRCTLDGPPVPMGARAALSTSLLIHELATNAAKYGALSRNGGHVSIVWRITEGGDPKVVLKWAEQGGPEVVAPTRKGFGSKLIRLGLVGTGGSAVRYDSEGFNGSFEARVEEVGQA